MQTFVLNSIIPISANIVVSYNTFIGQTAHIMELNRITHKPIQLIKGLDEHNFNVMHEK